MEVKALLLTLLVGFFFLIGMAITHFAPKKKTLSFFAIGLSFTVMLGMILFDIIPEIAEGLIVYENGTKWLIILGFTFLGFILLKCLDIFVPHHTHEHKENEKNHHEHNEHLFHIGFVTSISLILHNIIEGISIYATGLTDIKIGFMMTLAVALHNIPLGIEIYVGMSQSETKKKTKWIITILLTLSSFIGALVLFLSNFEMNEFVLTSLLCITFGMLLYISLFELLKEIWQNRRTKEIYFGILFGALLTVAMIMI